MTNRPTTPSANWFLLVASLSYLLLTGPNVLAQNSTNPQTSSGLQTISGTEQIKVVGHLPLPNMRVNQMFVQNHGGKVFLYLHRPSKQAYAVVDVTKPAAPVLLDRDTLKEAKGERVENPATGSVVAIAVTPEDNGQAAAAPVPLPTETVQFVDLSNPKNPKSVKAFKGVTSVYPDDSRKLVYLVNDEGLWIVGHHMTHPLPVCNSEAALTSEPDCQ